MASSWQSAKVDGSDMPLYLSVPESGGPVPGVVVDLTGNASDQVFTDADGNYLFTGLPADGAYFVTPSNQNFGFTPSDASIGALIADVGNVNFTQIAPTAASVSVSGRVLSAEGRGLSHVTVSIADPNGNVRSVHTNTFGYYRFDQVEVGMTYLIGVRSKRYQFENPDRAVSVQDELTDVDFIALPE